MRRKSIALVLKGFIEEFSLGRYYSVISSKTLNQGLESLVQKLQPGVVLQFEKMTSGLLAQSVAENGKEISK